MIIVFFLKDMYNVYTFHISFFTFKNVTWLAFDISKASIVQISSPYCNYQIIHTKNNVTCPKL